MAGIALFLSVQILTAEQIRAWDAYTVRHEPITPLDLMERAATKCVRWIQQQAWSARRFQIFCGPGNNGGDGLAIARLLHEAGYAVAVFVAGVGGRRSDEFQTNLERLRTLTSVDLRLVSSPENLPELTQSDVVVDALFGAGLNKPLEGIAAAVVERINASGCTVVSVDAPSGLFVDKATSGAVVVHASYTLTFQCYKLGLLVQENARYLGKVVVLDIGLLPGFLTGVSPRVEFTDEETIGKIYKPRNRFAHKGSFGHALIAGGSFGKIGAVALAARACSSGGAGLTTVHVPKCGYAVLQVSVPEAMVIADEEEPHLASLPDDLEKYSAVGVGPGMGTNPATQHLLSFLLRRYRKPMVVDADGLNILSQNKEWLPGLPALSVLTPHPKEFDRLFGAHTDSFARTATAQQKAAELNCIIVLKGHHTFVATPESTGYFNSTGNAGMAKGGSGDVLTGLITALLAQGYSPEHAAVLGVYLHGQAGDAAARKHSMEALLPGHVIECFSDVFLGLQQLQD